MSIFPLAINAMSSSPPAVDPSSAAPVDFFISYNQTDRGWAEWIAWQLEASGYRTLSQAWYFQAGGNFVLAMQDAAQRSRRTLAVLSKDFLAAKFTQPEWAAAFARDPTGAERRLLPVRIADCQPDGLLAPIVYIDLVGLAEEPARERLLMEIDAPPLDEAGLSPILRHRAHPRPGDRPARAHRRRVRARRPAFHAPARTIRRLPAAADGTIPADTYTIGSDKGIAPSLLRSPSRNSR